MRTISQIDKDIDANRLRSDWRRGDLRERELYRERGLAQLERDTREERARIAAAQKPLRKKKCESCGSLTYLP